MSKYTTEVRFYCETLAGYSESQDYDKIDSIVQTAAPKIFNNFPIWDEKYRLTLETKILKHYYVREICAETPGLWKLWLNNRMNEIMPYFNELYKSAELKFDPFHDVDITRDHTGEDSRNRTYTDKRNDELSETNTATNHDEFENESSSNGKSSTETEADKTYSHIDKYSDTPQGSVDGPIFANYLTNAREIADQTVDNGSSSTTQNSTTTNSGTDDQTINSDRSQTNDSQGSGTEDITGTDKYLEHIYGKQGTQSYSYLLKEFRETLLNIDMQIIDALGDLFMTLY